MQWNLFLSLSLAMLSAQLTGCFSLPWGLWLAIFKSLGEMSTQKHILQPATSPRLWVIKFFITARRFLATASAAGTTTLSVITPNVSTCSIVFSLSSDLLLQETHNKRILTELVISWLHWLVHWDSFRFKSCSGGAWYNVYSWAKKMWSMCSAVWNYKTTPMGCYWGYSF